jgi:hypothetical protein
MAMPRRPDRKKSAKTLGKFKVLLFIESLVEEGTMVRGHRPSRPSTKGRGRKEEVERKHIILNVFSPPLFGFAKGDISIAFSILAASL